MTTSQARFWLSVAAGLAVLGLGFDLGGYSLLDPDEGRNAEVAREMAATNDYVLPRLNTLPYLDKPVLYFAAGAAVMEILGPTATAARLPSLVFTLGTLVLVAWYGTRRFGREAGIVAATATAASPFTLAYARTVIFDSALTFFVVLALIGFQEAIDTEAEAAAERTSPERGWRWVALGWSAMALGVLTKGPIALALPVMVAIPYAALRRAWRVLADPTALLLFVALLLPWLFAVSAEIPEFLEYAIVTETALRLTTGALQRSEPFWYFLPMLPAATLPWSVVVIAGSATWMRLGPEGRHDPRIIFLALWILVPLAFFTLSQSKRPQYLLPLVPAVGLLVGAIWKARHDRLAGARAAAAFFGVLGVFLLLGHPTIPAIVDASPAVSATIAPTAVRLGGICLVAAVAGWVSYARRGIALTTLCLPVVAIPFVSGPLMSEIARARSAREIALAIERAATPATEVIAIRVFPPSLPFYLRQTITLSTADGAELTSNYLVRHLERWQRTPGTPLRPADWWLDALRLCERPRIFVVASGDRRARFVLDGTLAMLIDTERYAVYGPCGITGLARDPVGPATAHPPQADAEEPPRPRDGAGGAGRGSTAPIPVTR